MLASKSNLFFSSVDGVLSETGSGVRSINADASKTKLTKLLVKSTLNLALYFFTKIFRDIRFSMHIDDMLNRRMAIWFVATNRWQWVPAEKMFANTGFSIDTARARLCSGVLVAHSPLQLRCLALSRDWYYWERAQQVLYCDKQQKQQQQQQKQKQRQQKQ